MGGICHIPVKLGSQRLLIKNTLPVGDRPSFYWPTVAAFQSGCFDTVALTSDLPAFIARFKDWLPELEQADIAWQTPTSIVETTHEYLRKREREWQDRPTGDAPYTHRVSIALATAALLTPDIIRGAIALSDDTGDPVMAVTRFPYDRSYLLEEKRGGRLHALKRRWPKSPLWVDAGAFYTFPPGMFRKVRTLYHEGLRGYRVPRWQSVDVDDEEDYLLTKALFAAQHAGQEVSDASR